MKCLTCGIEDSLKIKQCDGCPSNRNIAMYRDDLDRCPECCALLDEEILKLKPDLVSVSKKRLSHYIRSMPGFPFRIPVRMHWLIKRKHGGSSPEFL